MHHIGLIIAIIGVAGIFAQWAAWRLRLPAIALLLLSGILLGPVFQVTNPAEDFGDLYRPLIGLAVAIILFEGGLTLNFREISGTSTAVRRIIMWGGPLVWLCTAVAAHYVGGLSWATASILGAILVVTGPTVIMPLLRTAKLSSRPAALLRWEAIVNDPIGALFAVLAFETVLILNGAHGASGLITSLIIAAIVGVGGGYLLARAIVYTFVRGYVPEYLKAPVIIVLVLIASAVSNLILEESGLLTVTVMGITLANSRIASLTEMRRFKETITVLLVSGVFILLTASLNVEQLQSLGWRAVALIALILFVIRPLVILLVTAGSDTTLKERLLVGWIAPRGIVAVAVAGLFGEALNEQGISDGHLLPAYVFAVVASTIILHGFSLSWLAGILGLKSSEKPGILIAGGSLWTRTLAKKLTEEEVPVLIVDSNWGHLKDARLANIPVYFGELLSAEAHHAIDFNRYTCLIAATDNDAYNTLICNEFGPELGRGNVFQIGSVREGHERQSVNFTIGGRALFKPGLEYYDLRSRIMQDWTISKSTVTEEFTFEDLQNNRHESAQVLFWIKPSGAIIMASGASGEPTSDDDVYVFGPKVEKSNKPEKNSEEATPPKSSSKKPK